MQDFDDDGYIARRHLPDGRMCGVGIMTYGKGRLYILNQDDSLTVDTVY